MSQKTAAMKIKNQTNALLNDLVNAQINDQINTLVNLNIGRHYLMIRGVIQ